MPGGSFLVGRIWPGPERASFARLGGFTIRHPRVSDIDKSPRRIAGMFDAIAGRYDLLNTVLSAGLDRRWRQLAIRSLGRNAAGAVLDICTGTADLAIAAAQAGGAQQVTGIDFAVEMLARGHAKISKAGLEPRVRLVRGDAMQLPVADAAADAVTLAFGIRNVQVPERACAELHRVLRPGGRLALLEFGLPVVPAVRPLYLWYFRHILPRIGKAVSGHTAAYSYLPESVATFPWGERFAALLAGAGFDEVTATPLTFGIVYLYTGVKSVR